jgi:serine protease AprX
VKCGGSKRGWGARTSCALAAAFVAAALAGAAGATPRAAPLFPPGLLHKALASPGASFRVIVVARPGVRNASIAALLPTTGRRKFTSINAVSGTLSGLALAKLASSSDLAEIVPDVPIASADLEESGLWRAATQSEEASATLDGAQPPAIAIVDSGVDSSKAADFGSRVVASVDLSPDPATAEDDEGHGTMVAGIAAGASAGYPGVASTAPIVSLRTADANGESHTSDVIAACDWILQHQADYDIRVANFSMVSEAESSFTNDPLDAAVEQLWFHGIVVVTAVGNYGTPGGVPVTHAPGNDPFVISVGALDTSGTADPSDDVAAPWSAYGFTGDGFAKPELSAPGRWIVAPVPTGSSLATTAPDRVVEPGYMWMSGTSLSAPVVSGAAALVLALHPDWTPDQVKGALMVSASALPGSTDWAGGVGEVDAARAIALTDPPNPNEGLDAFVSSGSFDGTSWEQAVQSSSEWSSSEWSSSEWSSSEWSSTEWSSTEWSSTDWSSTEWSSTEWSSTDWSATGDFDGRTP